EVLLGRILDVEQDLGALVLQLLLDRLGIAMGVLELPVAVELAGDHARKRIPRSGRLDSASLTPAMSDVRAFLRFWQALDSAIERVVETPWGALVSDARFPTIWDVNYARVDAERDVRLSDVRAAPDPELARTGARHEHVVCFWPELQTGLLGELGRGGNRISWDIVMIHRGGDPEPPAVEVEEVTTFDDAFWKAVRTSLAAFEVTEP